MQGRRNVDNPTLKKKKTQFQKIDNINFQWHASYHDIYLG